MALILVAGASGKVGQSVLHELQKTEHQVRALVRKPVSFPLTETVLADATMPASLQGVCKDVDVVVSAIGGSLQLARTQGKGGYWEVDYQANKNLLTEAQAAGVNKFIYVSAFQVEQMKGIAYGEAHAAFEEELKQSGMAYALIRPTGIFYIFEEFLKLAQKGVLPLIGAGAVRTNPIDEHEVARACVEAITSAKTVFDLGGPDVYSRREIAELCFRTLRKKPRFIQYPIGLMRLLIAPIKLVDRRLYDLLAFGLHASSTDLIAPRFGVNRLENYLQRLTASG